MREKRLLGATRERTRPSRLRLLRFLRSGLMLLQVYGGYRLIGLLERACGSDWAEARRELHHEWSARRFHQTAVSQQGLLIKTGQFLSSRPDILPDAYVDVLSNLQDEVPPEPFEVVRQVVERELGGTLPDKFQEFEREPIAAASLAQVHRAMLHSGERVAVKVQYPGIASIVAGDLKNIRLFNSILNRLDRTLDFSFISEEMSRMIPKELDFLNEGRNAEAIAANFAGVEDVRVPEIHWSHTTGRVLTMEYLDGFKITDNEEMRSQGVDPSEVAKILLVAFSEMLLSHGLFHADPHPGNLLVAPGPTLLLVDFGQVKEITPEFRSVFSQMTRAIMSPDEGGLGRSFRDLGFRMKQDSPQGYEDLGNAYVGNIAKEMRQTQSGWADEAMFRDSYREVLRILRENPLLKAPPDVLFVGRVMGLLNGLSMTLGSRTNLLLEMARLLDKEGDSRSLRQGPRRMLEAGNL